MVRLQVNSVQLYSKLSRFLVITRDVKTTPAFESSHFVYSNDLFCL